MERLTVFNLTDLETPDLKARGLVGQTIVVGTELVEPGSSVEVEDAPHRRAAVQALVDAGALAFERLPPSYAAAKAAQPAKQTVVTPPPLVEAEATLVVTPTEDSREAKRPRGKHGE